MIIFKKQIVLIAEKFNKNILDGLTCGQFLISVMVLDNVGHVVL